MVEVHHWEVASGDRVHEFTQLRVQLFFGVDGFSFWITTPVGKPRIQKVDGAIYKSILRDACRYPTER
ncbi:MAG: hypothetical protein KDA86_20485 [Planctomycetaceae bacterium]|nr:hypothetical protein [Planctomycetaceae bacterium]